MEPARPAFRPDPDRSREEMERLQREIAGAAVFRDDLPFDPRSGRFPGEGGSLEGTDADRARLGGGVTDDPRADVEKLTGSDGGDPGSAGDPLVAGVDQAFLGDDRAVSAVVALRDGAVVERAHAVVGVEIPYVPGLLAFREGGSIAAALGELSAEPDLLVLDGSGRIHFREAGIATHVGVLFDVPAVGVAKSLLCGEPAGSVEGLPEGARVEVLADDDVTAPAGTVVGHAYQSRQYDSADRHVNPLYVSPGHRVGAETATDLVARCCGGYKLPEPTRLADALADELKAELR